jgi:hypothetical protein
MAFPPLAAFVDRRPWKQPTRRTCDPCSPHRNKRRDVQALMMKVTVEPDDRENPKHPGAAPYDLVAIDTREGAAA